MARFYTITIGTIDLTETGAAVGTPCRLEIEGLEDLQVAVIGSSQTTAAGNRIRQTVEWTSGKEFSIKITQLTADVYADLKTFLNNANETDASFVVSGFGATGDFSVSVKPSLQKPFAAGKFIEDKIQDIVLRFET